MTTTPTYDELVVVFIEREFEPPCEHHQHGQPSDWHDDGPARFELLLPCGKPLKVCAQFVRALDAGGYIACLKVHHFTSLGRSCFRSQEDLSCRSPGSPSWFR